MIGRVVSTKSKNTAVVLVTKQKIHPLYKKAFERSKKYLVDDEIGVKEGDIVNIEKCKPISKHKHFKITKVLGQNLAEIVEEQQKITAAEVIAEVVPAARLPARQGRQVMPEEKESEQGTVDSEQSEESKEKPVKRVKKGKGNGST